MLLPRLGPPSYWNGFAHSAGESAYPESWKGLIGAWCPSLGPSGSTLRDLSGFGRHGTLGNMDPATDWIIGANPRVPGYTLDFDGTNDHIEIDALTDLNFNGGTILWWMNPDLAFDDGIQDGHKHWGQSNASGVPELTCQKFEDTNFYIGWNHSADDDRVIFTATAANYPQFNWSRYAFTWVSGGLSIVYRNGVKLADNGGGTLVVDIGEAWRIARQGTAGTDISQTHFNGKEDDFRIYNRALTPAEIAFDYQIPLAPFRLRSSVVGKPPAAAPARRIMIIADLMKYVPPSVLAGGMGLAWMFDRRNKVMRGDRK